MKTELPKQDRIPWHIAWSMLGFALFYDFLQFALLGTLIGFFINWSITVFAFLHFWFWFKTRGISLGDSVKKWVTWALTLGTKLASEGFFPSLLIGTALTIFFVKFDDALANKGIKTNLTTTARYRKKKLKEGRTFEEKNREEPTTNEQEKENKETADDFSPRVPPVQPQPHYRLLQ